MFNFISHLFSSDPEKKEKRRAEKEERDRLRAQRKHDQRIASKQALSDEWHPVNFPYQATIFNIQRANKGYGSTCQISVRYIENGQYKDIICLVNPKVKSFSFSNYHDIKPEDVAEKLNLDSYPSAKHPKATLDTITEILELMYEKRPGILRKLLGVKAK